MIHPETELRFISEDIGYGVVAKKFIPKGTITWVQDKLDREFTIDEISSMDIKYREILDTYCYRNRKGNYVFCWDYTKYMNHSFYPNCMPTAYGFEISIKDINVGEQLTNDYGCLNIIEPFRPVDEGAERKLIKPDDLKYYHKEWDELIKDSLPLVLIQNQPLKRFINEDVWQTLIDIRDGRCSIKSLNECYCQY